MAISSRERRWRRGPLVVYVAGWGTEATKDLEGVVVKYEDLTALDMESKHRS